MKDVIEKEAKTAEKIWYEYETEVFNKLPKITNFLNPPKIPKKLMERIEQKWVPLEVYQRDLEKKAMTLCVDEDTLKQVQKLEVDNKKLKEAIKAIEIACKHRCKIRDELTILQKRKRRNENMSEKCAKTTTMASC